jgi:hypothetical protein
LKQSDGVFGFYSAGNQKGVSWGAGAFRFCFHSFCSIDRSALGSWISPAFTAIRFEQNVPICTFGILAVVLVA